MKKIVVAHRLFRCPDLLAGAVFDRGLVDEDREQLVEGVAVAAGIAPQVEDDVGDALPFETDDRPAEDAHQAAVVGEKLRYGDVAAACIGVGADVGVGLLGLAQAEERVAVGESLVSTVRGSPPRSRSMRKRCRKSSKWWPKSRVEGSMWRSS